MRDLGQVKKRKKGHEHAPALQGQPAPGEEGGTGVEEMVAGQEMTVGENMWEMGGLR